MPNPDIRIFCAGPYRPLYTVLQL